MRALPFRSIVPVPANGALACCGDFSRSFAMSVSRVPAPFNYVRAVRGGF